MSAPASTLCLEIRDQHNVLKAKKEMPIPALAVNEGHWYHIEVSYGAPIDYISSDPTADCKNMVAESDENNNRRNAQIAPSFGAGATSWR